MSSNFALFPEITAVGTDELGAFEMCAISPTNVNGNTRFWKVYSNHVFEYDVMIQPQGLF